MEFLQHRSIAIQCGPCRPASYLKRHNPILGLRVRWFDAIFALIANGYAMLAMETAAHGGGHVQTEQTRPDNYDHH